MGQFFRNVVYLADRSGTGKWRRIWPIQSIDCIAQGIESQVDYSQTPVLDQNYYNGVNSITVQRWISDQQRDIFCKFFRPLMDAKCGWTIYEIDDLMFDGTLIDTSEERKVELEKKYGKNFTSISIPLFNRGRKAFEGQNVQRNIKTMLNMADFVTVTTDHIKEVYHDIYGIPMENILAVPNLLPKYLFGDRYRPEDKIAQFKQFKSKPRVGIVSSLSHYNIDGVRQDKFGRACRKQVNPDNSVVWMTEDNKEIPESETVEIKDDIDAIIECIRSTVNDVQWVFFGYCPPKLQDLVDKRKIEVHGGVPIQNYASTFDNLKLQLVIAAINKTEFNYCKSFIKTMECAALGVPCYATNCLPYSRVMPVDQLFDGSKDLTEKILKLKFLSIGSYRNLIEKQWNWLNSKHQEGDFTVNNFWLEDNMNIWVDMFRLRQKGVRLSLQSFVEQYENRKKTEKENTIFKNDNIQIMK